MSRTVYVNGAFVPEEEASVSIFDRGFLFADAIYEVTAVIDSKICEWEGHVARLERSLGEIGMGMPMSSEELLEIHRELVKRNDMEEGAIYLQITRGAIDRDFVMPKDLEQTVVLFTQAKKLTGEKKGLRVVSMPDIRWARRDIKTVQLLAASMVKTEAKKQGKDDAWMVEDGFVTEGSSNNTYIVTAEGKIITRNLSNSILPGITRKSVLRIAEEMKMEIEERPYTIEEAQKATEAFMTAATSFVTPVLEIDGVELGDGTPGPVSKRLCEVYIEEARKASC
ncbi:D-amino-acid transaminase [Maridesulfovibrio sp.]|jgi:D-alanine transaminase|uniref:D-amino-acid transaminase n=1 Tax=Maridesulfovibrio sp. TaxID=2795000 RepID=UPI0029CA127B|nr:D-amino-acid transaminase [Maridesulfovibrio sp.]